MQQLETTVLIVGAGPAGLTAALALSTYGIAATVLTRHRWLAPSGWPCSKPWRISKTTSSKPTAWS